MKIMVSGNRTQVIKTDPTAVGQLITPRCWTNLIHGRDYAVDNGAFSGFDEVAFLKMLTRIGSWETRPQWVAVPDVVANAHDTKRLFRTWEPRLRAMDFLVAYVIQDGQEWLSVPWEDVDCIFIGGSAEYKLGRNARWLASKAKSMGKKVHMGRVNSTKRLEYARLIGCDTVDGTGASRYTPKLFRFNKWCLDSNRNMYLFKYQEEGAEQ